MTDRSALAFDSGDRAHRLLEEIERVGEPLPRRGAEDGRARHLAAPLLERHEASREVAAVDRGDVARQERLEVLRLVPVEEVPLVVREALDALERAAHAQRQLARAEVAEVVRRERREEHHADVRRRRAVGRLLARLLLVVVDGEPLVVRAHEHVEEAPRPAGKQPQLAPLVAVAAARSRDLRGLAHPARNLGRDEPERQERARPRREPTASSSATSAARRHREERATRSSRARASARGDRAPSPNAVCAADVHWSRCLRVIVIRTTTRTIASTTTTASCARNAIARAQRREVQRAPPAVVRGAPGSSARGARRASRASRAAALPATRPARARGARSSSGLVRLRRRLSKIFQRSIGGERARHAPSRRPTGTLEKSHGRSCQSPRTHRCMRRAYAA